MSKQPETRPCPECEKYIPVTATRCRCGWVAKTAHPTYIECAFAGCPENAKLKIKTQTGWAMVCEKHDVKIVKERADAYCKSLGLDTVEKQRAWLLQNKPAWKRRPPITDYEKEIEEIPF